MSAKIIIITLLATIAVAIVMMVLGGIEIVDDALNEENEK